MTRAMIQVVLAAVVVCSTAVASLAQQPTTTTASETKTFEVIAVEGNQLVVRLPEGTRELTVADDFRFTVNGKPLSVRELKPGMKGTATITTKTTVTPVTVTEVKSGQVMQTSGSSIIVRTPEGVKMFTQGDVDKRGVKIVRDGKPAQITDLRTGDKLSATIITSMPPRVMTEKEVNATLATSPAAGGGAAASKPGAPPAATAGAAGAAASAAPARALPKTASSWPLLGLASILALATGLALTIRRRFVS
jgi:hypothetical protein